MNAKLDYLDYKLMHRAAFSPDHTGYRPDVVESPHGDGKWDFEKRYAHVALKYEHADWRSAALLDGILMNAHRLALRVAEAMRVPDAFMPKLEYGALRILEYAPGAGSHEHEDFDLFTLLLYRDQPDRFVSDWYDMPAEVRALNAQCHLGQLAAEIGIGKATKHSVLPSDKPQHSIVYFAIPDWSARLPSGVLVGDWLQERLARSRAYR